jgi:CheY-like chemotaxis protein/anti-sigma regulatory factor (Ser/Thr protein kinase)
MAAALNTSASVGEQPLAIPEPGGRRPLTSRPPVSILLVDDEERSLRTLEHVLEPLGQNLVSARSGEEALRWLLREDFALILLDMTMPGLDGLQTARYISSRSRTRHLPIIFLTAHAHAHEQVSGAHAAGAVDYVAKPFEPDLLRSKVSVFIELHHTRAEHLQEARARAEAEGIASTVSRLQSISDAALAHLELAELLPELLRRAARVFSADGAGLLLVDGEELRLTVLAGDEVDRVPAGETVGGLAALLEEAMAGATVNIAELPDGTPLPGRLREAGLQSLVAAPLSSVGDLRGVLFLGSREPGRFSGEDLVVLGLGAERAGVAIEHARSYEHERGLVELLQEHLLPDRLPEVAGLQLAGRYRPSERLAAVGGDWYDAIRLPDGSLGLVIGDVVGHGIAAAAMMAELRAAVRAYAIQRPDSPAAAVAELNRLVAATHSRMVATLLYLVVDAEGGGVRFANAGHPPPLLVEPAGGGRYLQHRPAAPLGVADRTDYRDFEARLPPGGTLLLYTDGLVERRGEAIDIGLRRLLAALDDGPAEVEELCAHLLDRADEGAALQDDTAIVAVRRIAHPEPTLELRLPAEPRSVAAARHGLSGWLARRGAPAGQVPDVVLAANEACTNAVEHAYGPERGASFTLFAEASPAAVVVRVCDDGSWREPRGRGRGRGLRMIEALMDGFEITRSGAGTTVEMRKEWDGNGAR